MKADEYSVTASSVSSSLLGMSMSSSSLLSRSSSLLSLAECLLLNLSSCNYVQ